MTAPIDLQVRRETWPIRGEFTISRGSKTAAEVVVVELRRGGATGRGECVPYPRYGESVEAVMTAIRGLAPRLAGGIDRDRLLHVLPPGAARNAVDCALWDLEAKTAGRPAWQLAGLEAPGPVTTAYTLALDTPDAMGTAARAVAHRPLLKLKLTGDGDVERVRAVRANAPDSRLIVDANEAWTIDHLDRFGTALAELGVEMIEQPLPAGADQDLAGYVSPVPLCADESCHDTATLAPLVGKYAVVNIKLDKTGGLTEALRVKRAAETAGLRVMVGCMLSTSLAMAPAVLVAQGADVVDLDGPLWLIRDRDPGLAYRGAEIAPPDPAVWG